MATTPEWTYTKMKSSTRRHIIMDEFNLRRSAIKKLKPKGWKKKKNKLLDQCHSAEHVKDHIRPKVIFERKNYTVTFSICLYCGQWYRNESKLTSRPSIKKMIRRESSW